MLRTKVLVVPAMLAAGLAIGLGVNSAPSHPADAAASAPNNPAPVFPKNESGQTYGSIANVTSVSQYPDLVLVQDTAGHDGYVLATQLNGPTPSTPQQAIAMNPTGPRTIPVYASNGKTVIGKFVVGGGTTTAPVSKSNPSG